MKSLFFIAGPCLVESKQLLQDVAGKLCEITKEFQVDLFFKGSYKKANRTSAGSFSGIGDELALSYLSEIRSEFGIPVLTDVHSESEVRLASDFVDVLQIPAFLSRQTELLESAARTGKIVNIKKGQFMAPEDVVKAAQKVVLAGNNKVWITERGTSFGYHDLIVDYRGLVQMRDSGHPVVFDATHSVQLPSIGHQSGGNREFIKPLARAAVAVGVDGVFFETHPDPANAKSDSATQLPLEHAREFIDCLVELHSIAR